MSTGVGVGTINTLSINTVSCDIKCPTLNLNSSPNVSIQAPNIPTGIVNLFTNLTTGIINLGSATSQLIINGITSFTENITFSGLTTFSNDTTFSKTKIIQHLRFITL